MHTVFIVNKSIHRDAYVSRETLRRTGKTVVNYREYFIYYLPAQDWQLVLNRGIVIFGIPLFFYNK
jgi:hypothetical protein